MVSMKPFYKIFRSSFSALLFSQNVNTINSIVVFKYWAGTNAKALDAYLSALISGLYINITVDGSTPMTSSETFQGSLCKKP